MNTIGELQTNAAVFLKVTDLTKLCHLLEIGRLDLKKLLENKVYNTFFVKKPNGGDRLIEDPPKALQDIQEILNDYLQSVYYLHRSAAAFGFQLVIGGENNPRTIKSNAERHLHKPWLLNADFRDFFHQVSDAKLRAIFENKPFRFSSEVVDTLIEIVSYNGRLPMGAPSSPVLSNFAVLLLDADLQAWADTQNVSYTRFADDLTFSSLNELHLGHYEEIKQIIGLHEFELKPEKFKLCGPKDQKIVTGIVVSNKLSLEDSYLKSLRQEINKYEAAREINAINGVKEGNKLKTFEQKLEGHLQYVGMVYGKNHGVYKELEAIYLTAKVTKIYPVVSWLDFNNYVFINRKK